MQPTLTATRFDDLQWPSENDDEGEMKKKTVIKGKTNKIIANHNQGKKLHLVPQSGAKSDNILHRFHL